MHDLSISSSQPPLRGATDCSVSEEQLWSWIDRDAPELAEHVERCALCAGRARELSGLIDAVSGAAEWSQPNAPEQIGPFRIRRMIGEGAMGIVYEAQQEEPRRSVALKLLKGGGCADEVSQKLFSREVLSLAMLRHPGIAQIYQAGRTKEGHRWFAMEFVNGLPISQAVRGMSIDERLRLFVQVCRAVHFAHTRGIIHRDLKPGNILVAREDDEALAAQATGRGRRAARSAQAAKLEVKILDFGLARATDGHVGMGSISGSGQVIGTLPYMSPEQVRGRSAELDSLTDVYSLGVLLFELLTGRLPYHKKPDSLANAVDAICVEEPLRLVHAEPRLQRDLEVLVAKGLEKEPERRYSSAAALADDVERFLSGLPIQARPPSASYLLAKFVQRHRALSALSVALMAMICGFGILSRIHAGELNAASAELAIYAKKANDLNSLLVETFGVTKASFYGPNTPTEQRLRTFLEDLESLGDYPRLTAPIHRSAGVAFRDLGLYVESRQELETSLRQFEKVGPPMELARTCHHYAILLLAMEESERSEQMARRGLAALESVPLPPRGSLYARLNLHVAQSERRRGLLRNALERCERTLADLRDHGRRKRDFYQRIASARAGILRDLGRLGESEQAYHEVVLDRIAIHGKGSRLEADARLLLAWVIRDQGREADSRAAYAEALALHREHYSADSMPMARFKLSYAKMLIRFGVGEELTEAERLLQEALASFEQAYSPRHARVVEARAALSELREKRG